MDHTSLASTLKLFGQVIQRDRVVPPLADRDTARLAVEGQVQNRIVVELSPDPLLQVEMESLVSGFRAGVSIF